MEGKKGMMVGASREEMVHLSAVSPSLSPLPVQSCENVSRSFAAGNLAVELSGCVDNPPRKQLVRESTGTAPSQRL